MKNIKQNNLSLKILNEKMNNLIETYSNSNSNSNKVDETLITNDTTTDNNKSAKDVNNNNINNVAKTNESINSTQEQKSLFSKLLLTGLLAYLYKHLPFIGKLFKFLKNW